MILKKKNHLDLACLLPGSGALDILTGGTFSRLFAFGGGSSSKSSQSSSTKDNSSVGEDEFLNVTDDSVGARDNAISAGKSIKKSDLSRTDNSGRTEVDLGDESSISIETADAEITGKAFEESAETTQRAIEESADTSRDAVEEAFGFGTSTVQEAIDAVGDNSERAFELVDDATYESLQANRDVTDDAFDFSGDALAEVGESNRTIAGVLDEALGFAETSQEAANQLSRTTNQVLATKSSDADSAVSATLQKNVLIGTAIIAGAIVVSRLPNS